MSEQANEANEANAQPRKLSGASDGSRPTQSAIARAADLYAIHLPERDFMIDLMLFLRRFTVVCYPDLFAMAREIRSDATPLEVADLERPIRSPDAWMIWMVVGGNAETRKTETLKRLAGLLPYRLPWLCFYRKWDDFRVLKRYATERVMRRMHYA